MTELRLKLLDLIRERIATRGVAPSYREMCRELGLGGHGAVFQMVNALVRDGLLLRAGVKQHRSLTLPGVDLLSVPTARLVAELERRGRRRAA